MRWVEVIGRLAEDPAVNQFQWGFDLEDGYRIDRVVFHDGSRWKHNGRRWVAKCAGSHPDALPSCALSQALRMREVPTIENDPHGFYTADVKGRLLHAMRAPREWLWAVYHSCQELPVTVRMFGDGFQPTPWKCPICGVTASSDDLRYDLWPAPWRKG